MKKLLAIVLAAACAVSMAACAAKTGGIITLPEASMADGQLAAPPEVTSVPYPKDTDFVKDGKVDYSGYDKACDDWQAARQERLQTMVDPADVAHWFTSSIPVLLQGAGDENRVCSPLNVYMALAMLAAVTDGQTQGQILDALGADSLDELQTRAALLWQENSWNDGLVTSLLANSIWLQDGYEYNEDTLKKLGEEFFASAFSGEMGSEDYNKQLQSWLNDNTGGLLTEQAGGVQLRPETVLALVSTIYYSAQWSDQFYEGANTEETFHAPTGDETATFLHSSRSGTVYYGDGFMATELPLRSSGSMWLLKPDAGVTPEDLLQSEDAVGFLLANGSWSQTQQAEVDLSLPKFDVSSDLDLLDALAQLGMTDVQTPGAADFTPLTTANQLPLALTEAKHAARVKIDEDGCEAAAYTILSVCETAAMPPEEIVEFKRDEYVKEGVTADSIAKLKGAFPVGPESPNPQVVHTFEVTGAQDAADKGTQRVTAANASGINDGAAAIVLASGEAVEKYGLKPMAKLIGWGQGGVDPKIMGVGPVPASRQALKKAGLTIDDIDLVEANEAFAAQSIAVARELHFDMSKVNVNGGAIALGHPVGASGARIIVTLLHEMQKRPEAKRGLATLCIGGGMGVATIYEKC